MAELAKGRMRLKIPALVQALTGNFGEHHGFLCHMHLTRIDELSATSEELSARSTRRCALSPHRLNI